MSTASGPGSRALLTAALANVRRCAARGGDELLHHVPDTGDLVTGRVVDEFVEQASDTLRALAESAAETLERIETLGVGAMDAADRDRGWEAGA